MEIEREMHRALVDAGYAPLAPYVAANLPRRDAQPPCGCRKCKGNRRART